jgi:hypothetical protein
MNLGDLPIELLELIVSSTIPDDLVFYTKEQLDQAVLYTSSTPGPLSLDTSSLFYGCQ